MVGADNDSEDIEHFSLKFSNYAELKKSQFQLFDVRRCHIFLARDHFLLTLRADVSSWHDF